MKYVNNYEGYLKERNSFGINEGVGNHPVPSTLYTSDPKFKDAETLKADILKNAGPALNNLLSRQGIKYNPLTTTAFSPERFEFKSNPLTGKDLGVMQYGFKNVEINIKSTRLLVKTLSSLLTSGLL